RELWSQNLVWDDPVGDEFNGKWSIWLDELKQVSNVTIPRRFDECVSNNGTKELHIFCDASCGAMAAVAYIRTDHSNGLVNTRLVMAKCRVTPPSGITIPRAELIAALMGSRLRQHLTSKTLLKVPV